MAVAVAEQTIPSSLAPAFPLSFYDTSHFPPPTGGGAPSLQVASAEERLKSSGLGRLKLSSPLGFARRAEGMG